MFFSSFFTIMHWEMRIFFLFIVLSFRPFQSVHADGAQLQKITKLVERRRIVPKTDPRVFSLAEAGEALRLVAQGHTNGKVILRLE